MKQDNSINQTNNKVATDSIYELQYFNSNGLLNKSKIKQHLSILFTLSFFISLYSQFIITNIKNINEIDSIKKIIEKVGNELIEFYVYNIDILSNVIFYQTIKIEEQYQQQLLISALVAILIVLVYIFIIIQKSKFQAALSSANLSQYYLYKKRGNSFYLKFKKGQKNQYKTFINQRENLSQILGVENLNFKRWKKNGVVMQYTFAFPTIEDLVDLNVKDFIKKGNFFLGVGLTQIDEEFDKKDLIKKKYIPKYFKFEDLPHSIAVLGSSNGGKSNSLNQYLYSIFYNFEQIHSFYFIDFKSIEVQPIIDLEQRVKTNKIFTYDDNRLELYKVLKRLYFINKARTRYLRAKKMKKFITDFIFIICDELAEILDYKPINKEEKKIQEKIVFYIESLLRVSRSQGYKITYAAQSFMSVSTNISSGMRNNTLLKISHQLGSKIQVSSIKDMTILDEYGIDPTQYDIGKNMVIDETKNDIFEVRSLYVPEDFIEDIEINFNHNHKLEEELKIYYKEVYDEMVKDLKEKNELDDELYPLYQIAIDLKFEVDSDDIAVKNTIKEDSEEIDMVKNFNISQSIKENKSHFDKKYTQEPTNTNENEDFIDLIK